MGEKEPWQVRFRRFLAAAADAAGVERPRIVVMPKRASNPKITPVDWYEEEVNKLLPKQDETTRDLPPAA